ncbi:hypothetical protein THRCLA_00372 [Thraustotheca clavata]|uniref:LNR domain-containing protein n=1 Tax=Thraustotheca clavata TaxID=74557 RepID=A0A1W0ABH2_9STRA|nr:hypothetical protein THRCLA_00372 [Thraustotheca clavata]
MESTSPRRRAATRVKQDYTKVALFFGTKDADWTSSERLFLLTVAYFQATVGFLNFFIAGLILWTFSQGQAELFGASSTKATSIIFWFFALLYLLTLRPPARSNRIDMHAPFMVALPTRRFFDDFRPPANIEIGLSHTAVIVCQTYLAYLMAEILTQQLFATSYALLVVLNSIVTPWFLFAKSTRSKRILLDLGDSFLSFTLSVGLSLVFFLLPLLEFQLLSNHDESHAFTWFAVNLSGIRIFLVMPPLQLVSTSVPNLAMVICLRSTIVTLRTMQIKDNESIRSVQPMTGPAIQDLRRSSNRATLISGKVGWRRRTQLFSLHQKDMHALICIFTFNIVWGLTVLGILLHAQYEPRMCPSHCMASSKPWFSSGCSCIYAQLDCSMNMTSDVDSYFTKSLLGSNLQLLHTIRCPLRTGLSEHTLGLFTNLFGYSIEFSNMTEWNIPPSSYPSTLRVAIIRYSKLTTVPLALQSPNVNLRVIHLVGAPIQSIPNSVWRNWTQLTELWLSSTQLNHIPNDVEGLSMMEELILSANNLSTIPAFVINMSSLERLDVDANPINVFPLELVLAKPTLALSLEHTAITQVSLQAYKGIENGYIRLYSTPYCEDNALSTYCVKNCASTCSTVHWGDYYCDISCNSSECQNDKGDCVFI